MQLYGAIVGDNQDSQLQAWDPYFEVFTVLDVYVVPVECGTRSSAGFVRGTKMFFTS